MASKSAFSEGDFSCPVCHDIFKDPVLLPCSHSLCKACLQEWWRGKRVTQCPVCKKKYPKKKYSTEDPPCNLALKNLCEAFTQERRQRASKRQRTSSGSEDLCSLHTEELKLFCLECQEPSCVVCLHSEKHTKHSFRPIDEAALDHKDEIQKSLMPLQEKLNVFTSFKTTCDKVLDNFKTTTQKTESQINSQFKLLHIILQMDEEARIKALRDEEQQKCQMMREKIEDLVGKISSLSHTIGAIEEELRAEHLSFLQNYKTTKERVQLTLQDPQPVSVELIDVAEHLDVTKHLGNLKFRVWEKMGRLVGYTAVVMNPDTGNSSLVFSDDLTTVSGKGRLEKGGRKPLLLLDKPGEEIDYILGSECFKLGSGCHSWEVEVEGNQQWEVGVLSVNDHIPAYIDALLPHYPDLKYSVEFRDGKYRAKSSRGPDTLTESSLEQTLISTIRVRLNCIKRRLSFFDVEANEYLLLVNYSMSNTFIPFFYTSDDWPLSLLPRRNRVTVELNDGVEDDDTTDEEEEADDDDDDESP